MAYISQEFCNKCGKTRQCCNGKCTTCRDTEYRQQVAAWDEQTVEQMLNDLRVRVERLEQGPPRY